MILDCFGLQEVFMKKLFVVPMLSSAILLLSANFGFAQPANDGRKSIVVYFSLAGEQYNVGKISEGNTEIIAEMIADETDSDLFRIETVRSYSVDDHRALLDEARTEQRENARPALKSDVQNFERYGTIYIGYPIWWGDIPMPVYTFLESHDWSGKTVVPFATHEGSGLSGTERNIRSSCRNADVLKGLAVRGRTAQTNRASARKEVRLWLEQIRKK